MFDLVIRGDRIVTPQRVDALDIAVQGEKIVAIGRRPDQTLNSGIAAIRQIARTGRHPVCAFAASTPIDDETHFPYL